MLKGLKLLFLLIFISCSSSKVITDYDADINFSSFRTYAFYEDIGKGLNELDVKRIMKTITSELEQRNFKNLENPDFYINVISKITQAQNNTIGINIGSGNRNSGFGISGGIPIGGKKLNEEFIIEFVNAKTDKIIWEGVLNSTIKENRKPEEKEIHFQEIVKNILDKYPPQKN